MFPKIVALLFFAVSSFRVVVSDSLSSTTDELQSSTTSGITIPPLPKKILKEMSWGLKSALLKGLLDRSPSKRSETSSASRNSMLDSEKSRRVGFQALALPARRQETESDDSSMKMKLFRLMYETVRDSDLKVKRAELIKKSYANSTSFEVGYLMGDITDKFNIMTDIALTLKRLYHEWKPIEHINAYEQIANLGIEITHIVDMIKSLEKKLVDEEPPPTTTTTTTTTMVAETTHSNNTVFKPNYFLQR